MTFAEHLLPQHTKEVQSLTQNPEAQVLADSIIWKVEGIVTWNFASIVSKISPQEAKAILAKAANDNHALALAA